MVAHLAQLAGNIGQVSNQISEITGTVKELAERVDRQPKETRAVATEVVRSALAQLPQAGMDTPPQGPPPPPERIELPMQHRFPDAPEPVVAPKPMAASSSGFQPRLESVYPDTGRPDSRIETGHADGWRYNPNARPDALTRSQMTLGRAHSRGVPSLPSERPATF
eukprot:6200567-Pleurochrysis_carterae.AAC.2